jgi:pyruvate kinase
MSDGINPKIQEIRASLENLENKMNREVGKSGELLKSLHPSQYQAGKNLLEYLTIRAEDLRNLQDELHIHGLSSLASSEGHIRRQIQAIQERLGKNYPKADIDTCTYSFCKTSIKEKSKSLFGPKPEERIPSLMVTFDSRFSENYALIKSLLQNGMNVARINCAHDDEATWSRMINKLKKACRNTGLECKVYMDLAGPKIRTKLLAKGKTKGRVKVEEGQLVWLAENDKDFKKEDVVISPNVEGIIPSLKKGDRVYLDDGVIRALVEKVKSDRVGIRITRISTEKKQIKNGKGINFPDTPLQIASLTAFDRASLPYICEHADLVGYSFVKTAQDIRDLRGAMKELTDAPPSMIIKIETPEAVKNLPNLLLEGMHEPHFGIMIARGDLAVEIGFERMGEVQEEILWICEAAHVPVVWATQVLESLNKSGMATRSEITDAGNAAQADCVMINKGDHTVEVMETLKDILLRTASHRIKKRYTFRPLQIAQRFFESEEKAKGQV